MPGGVGRGGGGVDDVEGVAKGEEGALDEGLEERVVSATEDEGGDGGCRGEGFGEVDAEDFRGDGVVDPTLFD